MCDANGVTPLHVAAYHGRRDIVGLLLTAGASCFAQCSSDVYDSGMPCNSGELNAHKVGHYICTVIRWRHAHSWWASMLMFKTCYAKRFN